MCSKFLIEPLVLPSKINVDSGKNYFFKDINRVEKAFILWSKEFSMDCNKIAKGTEYKWYNRNVDQITAVADRTRNRLGC